MSTKPPLNKRGAAPTAKQTTAKPTAPKTPKEAFAKLKADFNDEMAKNKAKSAAAGKTSILQKVKAYGPVGVATHSSLYAISLFSIYGCLKLTDSSGTLLALMQQIPYIGEYAMPDPTTGQLGVVGQSPTLVAAILAAEITDPLRLPISMALTPYIKRLWDAYRGNKSDDADGNGKPPSVAPTPPGGYKRK
jgi:hypothetical protein